MKLILCIFSIFVLIFFTTQIKLKIGNLEKSQDYIEYKIYLEIYFFYILKIFHIRFSKKDKIFSFIKIFDKSDKKSSRKLKKIFQKSNIDKFNLKLKIGLDDAILTSFSVSLISAILAIYEKMNLKKINFQRFNYEIIPKYDTPSIDVKMDAIFSINFTDFAYFFIFER